MLILLVLILPEISVDFRQRTSFNFYTNTSKHNVVTDLASSLTMLYPWSSSKSYHLIEPHPTTPSTGGFHIGRGGSGNVVPTNSDATTRGPNATGPASRTPLPRPQFYSAGRGGVGNLHSWCSEHPIFSFDEELEAQMQQDIAPVYHIGRGGAGNTVYIDGSSRRASSDSLKSTSSSSSAGSGADIFNRKLSRGFKRQWSKVKGVGDYMTG